MVDWMGYRSEWKSDEYTLPAVMQFNENEIDHDTSLWSIITSMETAICRCCHYCRPTYEHSTWLHYEFIKLSA